MDTDKPTKKKHGLYFVNQELAEEIVDFLTELYKEHSAPLAVRGKALHLVEEITGEKVKVTRGNVHPKHIKQDGTVTMIEPINGTDFTLAELQGYVGGLIEVIDMDIDGGVLVVNEEGQINGSGVNVIASIAANKTIYGDAVACASEQLK